MLASVKSQQNKLYHLVTYRNVTSVCQFHHFPYQKRRSLQYFWSPAPLYQLLSRSIRVQSNNNNFSFNNFPFRCSGERVSTFSKHKSPKTKQNKNRTIQSHVQLEPMGQQRKVGNNLKKPFTISNKNCHLHKLSPS